MIKRKSVETQPVVSEELEQYLTTVIGSIDCGEVKSVGDNNIIDLEQKRRNYSRNSALLLVEHFGLNHAAPNSPQNLSAMFPQEFANSLNLDVMISYTILGILKAVLHDVDENRISYYDAKSHSQGIKYDMNNHIYKRANWYYEALKRLALEMEVRINGLLDNSIPPFDFTNPSLLSSDQVPKNNKRLLLFEQNSEKRD